MRHAEGAGAGAGRAPFSSPFASFSPCDSEASHKSVRPSFRSSDCSRSPRFKGLPDTSRLPLRSPPPGLCGERVHLISADRAHSRSSPCCRQQQQQEQQRREQHQRRRLLLLSESPRPLLGARCTLRASCSPRSSSPLGGALRAGWPPECPAGRLAAPSPRDRSRRRRLLACRRRLPCRPRWRSEQGGEPRPPPPPRRAALAAPTPLTRSPKPPRPLSPPSPKKSPRRKSGRDLRAAPARASPWGRAPQRRSRSGAGCSAAWRASWYTRHLRSTTAS